MSHLSQKRDKQPYRFRYPTVKKVVGTIRGQAIQRTFHSMYTCWGNQLALGATLKLKRRHVNLKLNTDLHLLYLSLY